MVGQLPFIRGHFCPLWRHLPLQLTWHNDWPQRRMRAGYHAGKIQKLMFIGAWFGTYGQGTRLVRRTDMILNQVFFWWRLNDKRLMPFEEKYSNPTKRIVLIFPFKFRIHILHYAITSINCSSAKKTAFKIFANFQVLRF